ncbi:DUF1684 domain-containing protein [Hymenobacter ginsengisoli]|uniref:DUF1684 domain-containing protein n=1 Tax=Hymenobacter ginsengisoli TaxID=1051626 RepID=A0ABP8Q121_9BACT|nr:MULTISPECIES: DUF1684 domain-containing protein [unclassified Hymenobacter]MBO2033712.1 DUF1684 domain-containing protein [Hymenobacter sp. BT559]
MRKILLAVGLLAIVGLLAYSFSDTQAPAASPETAAAYAAQVRQARQQKDNAFRTAATSPIPVAQRAAFGGLRYFKPDAAYRVAARLTRAADLASLPLALTGGSADAYVRWGTAEFELGGRPQKLTLLQKQGETKELFVPFTDPTNGEQTYGGGRYLDLPVPAAEATEIVLDFNAAYSPFCAYNHAYSCPRPPTDNRLTVPVLAGEQLAPQ